MTAASVSPTGIASILERLPDYARFDRVQSAHDEEVPYRLAIGRMVKAWGDLLLDVVEVRPSPLNRNQGGMVDALLQAIGEIFQALNADGEINVGSVRGPQLRSLRSCDSDLLQLIEVCERTTLTLKQKEFAGAWIDAESKPLYATLRRLHKQLTQRNRVLSLRESLTLPELDLDCYSPEDLA